MEVNSRTIQLLLQGHGKFIDQAECARQYFANHNKIKDDTGVLQRQAEAEKEIGNPLRMADNRISHNWHNLLVTQKVSYALSFPPTFDLGDKTSNARVSEVLGDQYTGTAVQLGLDASNTSVGWLHYWRGQDGSFRYHTVDPVQIIPVFSGTLDSDLVGVLRCYTMLDPEQAQHMQVCEFWDDTRVRFYRQNTYGKYAYFDYPELGREMVHGLGAVPFIPFYNNAQHMGDLPLYKDLIDAYDKVVSGFANDMEDVQEIIFVLKNYGGEDKTEFVQDLRQSKVIKVEADGGVDTIRAEIPHEARGEFLDRVHRQIFVSGMGVDPDPERFGDSSGVALKYLYSLLELKAGMMETQFRTGFAELVRAICRVEGMAEPAKIIQTWTRNMVQNDLETAQIAAQSVGVISDQTIVKNHPWVDDAEAELKQMKKEKEEAAQEQPQFQFPAQTLNGQQDGDPANGDGSE